MGWPAVGYRRRIPRMRGGWPHIPVRADLLPGVCTLARTPGSHNSWITKVLFKKNLAYTASLTAAAFGAPHCPATGAAAIILIVP